MTMLDPITGLPTPISHLGNRPVLSGFPISGLTPPPTPALSSLASSLPTSNPLGGAGGFGTGATGLGGANPLRAASGISGLYSSGGASRAGGLIPRAGSLAPQLTKGALLRGSGYGTAGLMASGLIDRTDIGGQNSNYEQALQGLAAGAGLGAGVGSVVPGIGTALGAGIGAAGGAALGVLTNTFFKKKAKPDPLEVLATAMAEGGLDEETKAQIINFYNTRKALAEQFSGDEKKAYMTETVTAASDMVLGAINQASQPQANNSLSPVALQALAQNIFGPVADSTESSAQAYAEAMRQISPDLPAQFRPFAEMDVARNFATSSNLANAYRAQAALFPTTQAMTQYQQDFNNFASQLWQQDQAQRIAGMTGAGGAGQDPLALAALGG